MTPEEAQNFLFDHGLAPRGASFKMTSLAGGVSSDIVRIDIGDRSICLKRALPKLKVAGEWRADVRRNAHEVEWLAVAGKIVPGAVPAVLAADSSMNIYAMPFLDPATHPVWKSELMAARIKPGFAASVATLLARIHSGTANDAKLAEDFRHDADFAALRLDPYLTATARAQPTLAATLLSLRARTATTQLALVHGDVSPKNILMGPSGPVLLDAECAWFGDPAFDLAFLLNHLCLKCLVNPAVAAQYMDEFRTAVRAYSDGCEFEAWPSMQSRVASLLPALMLARIDGLSPVDYLSDERQRALVRKFAAASLLTPRASLEAHAEDWQAAVTTAYQRFL